VQSGASHAHPRPSAPGLGGAPASELGGGGGGGGMASWSPHCHGHVLAACALRSTCSVHVCPAPPRSVKPTTDQTRTHLSRFCSQLCGSVKMTRCTAKGYLYQSELVRCRLYSI
jgi:hypothetical protein